MARKRTVDYSQAPATLEDNPFFGLTLDDDQKKLRDAIWDDNVEIVFCDAAAGCGKTCVSVATAVLMHHFGKKQEIIYIMHPCADTQGYLPGTITEKSSVYFEGLYQALQTAGEDPDHAIHGESMVYQKNGEAYITAITSTYTRGVNFQAEGGVVLIIDEAQNLDEFSLRKVLTRACDGTKVVVIGHQMQCDLPNPKKSGFAKCMEHFRSKHDSRVAFVELTHNHRGFVARTADESWDAPANKYNVNYIPDGCICAVVPRKETV